MDKEVYKAGDYKIILERFGINWYGTVLMLGNVEHKASPRLKKKEVIENIVSYTGIMFSFWQRIEGDGQ